MSFDRLAPFYRAMEWFLAGNKLQRCRVAWLDEVHDSRRALLVGEGHGRFLAGCAKRFPETHFTCVDASRAMLDLAQSAWRNAGGRPERVSFVHATLPDWSPPEAGFDLIVTDFFLDCFSPPQLAEVIAKLSTAARPGTRWLIADFRVPDHGWRRLRAKLILSPAYAFFRLTTKLPARQLTAPDEFFRRHDFQLLHRHVSEWGLLHTDIWHRADRPVNATEAVEKFLPAVTFRPTASPGKMSPVCS